ncbi:MAG: acyl-CoA dehydrogenase family protein [Acidimicrobiales bacterium]|nr:acyl-CoA dehydrogenase family protein [Acidimicrobiales bacterium]
MDYALGESADELRERLRSLIAREIPAGWLGAFSDDPADLERAQAFCRTLADEGLLTLAWPEEYGGAGGSVWDQTVVREEMWAHHEPRGAQYMGLNWVGPAIMAYGTDQQKERFLPPIARGEVIWCQGFSEPEAGSDLASLITRADPIDDASSDSGYRINGQKIWTSYAEMAQWCVLAARVGPKGERKHEGITMFLLPMDSPGITVRPIQSMLGRHHLNEVFFDDVEVGPEAVLGEVGDGWSVIRRALAHERVGIARYARCERLLSMVAEEAGGLENLPPALRTAWARALTQVRSARLLAYRAVEEQERGEPRDETASAARLSVVQADQSVAELLFQVLEDGSLDAGASAPLAGAVEDHWRYAQAATVASGTIEIQRIIVSRALIGAHR